MSKAALAMVEDETIAPAPVPPIHAIERWWDEAALTFLRRLLAAIHSLSNADAPERTLLLVAFCRTMIALSNAAFNHQSMSFKDHTQVPLAFGPDMSSMFSKDVRFVLHGAAENPEGQCDIILGDSRNAAEVVRGRFERVITSPPYANRMSYIRELRPYMYWLGFLVNGRDAGEMDWLAIGGTWGVATSRLVEWQRNGDRLKNDHLEDVLTQIAHRDNKSGEILANYVAKYFDDMWAHVQSLPSLLAPDAEVHYVVGNSTFYGVLLSTERIYAAMLEELGFKRIECRALRKRNSKKELIEFDVVGRWSKRR
jgi:hypothetical protein